MRLEVLDPDEANSRATLFDTTTSLTPRPGRPGQFRVHLDPVWSSLVGMHGGYLAALAIRAAEIVVGDRPIRTVTTSLRVDPPVGGISISYTIHVHRTLEGLGDDEWLGGIFRADISAGGIALEKGMITDPSGRVLAESFHTRWTAGPSQLPP